MSVNRYRLRHRARQGHRGARLTEKLLERPDRLIGLILLGNNLANFAASGLTTLLAYRIAGAAGATVAIGIFTFVVLIFAEVTPKTFAAVHPAKLAIPASYIYYPLMKVALPFVWFVNTLANGLLRMMGVRADESTLVNLSREELRTVVAEAGLISTRHQQMLLGILDLGDVTVEDVMVPRNDLAAIDLEDDWRDIVDQVATANHTRLPVCEGDVSNIRGIIHLRHMLNDISRGQLTRENLLARMTEPQYVPETTPLNRQLVNFQKSRNRMAVVVDEYGDVQGVVTLEDILEEIVGEFTTDTDMLHQEVHAEDSGSYIVNGSANVRLLNRMMNWQLPTDGPKTLNGLILEHLESIPEPGTDCRIGDMPIEIVQTVDNQVKTARISPLPAD